MAKGMNSAGKIGNYYLNTSYSNRCTRRYAQYCEQAYYHQQQLEEKRIADECAKAAVKQELLELRRREVAALEKIAKRQPSTKGTK